MKKENITAGILAGGKSSRMGENKAYLKFQDKSFLEIVLEATKGFACQIVSVDDVGKYQGKLPDCVTMAQDELHEIGPVEGIYQILSCMTTQAALITATDMPLVTAELFERMAQQYDGEGCLVLTWEGKPQPLCAIYSKDCLPELEQFRINGIRKPRLVFEQIPSKYLAIEQLGYDDCAVCNVNTPGEYKVLREKTESGNKGCISMSSTGRKN